MAALSRSRRSAAGIAFIVGGALMLLGIILGYAAINFGNVISFLANLAIAVGFFVLALGSVANRVAQVALFVAAAGWALMALGAVVALPSGIGTLAAVAAAVGGVVGAVVLYRGKEITDRSAIAFIVTTAIAALLLLAAVAALSLAGLYLVLSIALGAGFIITGPLFREVIRNR